MQPLIDPHLTITSPSSLRSVEAFVSEVVESYDSALGMPRDVLTQELVTHLTWMTESQGGPLPPFIEGPLVEACHFISARIRRDIHLVGPFDCSNTISSGRGDPTERSFAVAFEQMEGLHPEVITAILVHELSHAIASVSVRPHATETFLFRAGLRFMGKERDLYEALEEVAALHNENTYLLSQGWKEKVGKRVISHPATSKQEDILFRACYLDAGDDGGRISALLEGSEEVRVGLMSPLETTLPYVFFEKDGERYATKYQCILPSVIHLAEEVELKNGTSLLDLLSSSQVKGDFDNVARVIKSVYGTRGLLTLAHLPTNDYFRASGIHVSRETQLLALYSSPHDEPQKTLLRSCIERMMVHRHQLKVKPKNLLEARIDRFLHSYSCPNHYLDEI